MDKIISVAADNRLESANIKGITIDGMKDNQNIKFNLYFVPADVDVNHATQLLASQYMSAIQEPSTDTSPINITNALSSLNTIAPISAAAPTTNTARTSNSTKFKIANELQPAVQTIKSSDYGNQILNQILNHPNLHSLTIQTHPQSSDERKRMGITPSATTELTFYDNGQLSAVVTMDADMLAQVMTNSGQGITVDADNILFHELSHVLLELNNQVDRSNRDQWQQDAELIASDYESLYGGYARDYFRDGSYAFWG